MSDVAENGTTAVVGTAAEQQARATGAIADGPQFVPAQELPHNARETAVQPDNDADAAEDEAPPRGRPVAHTQRSRKTAQDKWKRARTAEAKKEAVAWARRNGLLNALSVEAITWGLNNGVLTERQAAQAIGLPGTATGQQPQVAAPPAVPSAGAASPTQSSSPASAPAGGAPAAAAAPATGTTPVAVPGAQPAATPAPPTGPLYMGQPAERVAMFASIALPVLDLLSKKLPTSLDMTAHTKATLFRGLPIETKVDAVPLERMAELMGVVAAKRWPAEGGDSDPASQAKTELLVLATATFGPAVVAAGKSAVAALVALGRGLGARVKARRGGGAAEVAE